MNRGIVMFKKIGGVFLVILLLSLGAKAEMVVELYTSQGCSSCPPADEFLAELSNDDHIIPLAFHVSYWDYIGWKDIFARNEHVVRQKAYIRRHKMRTVATPQFIIDGTQIISGMHPTKIFKAIHKTRFSSPSIQLYMREKNGKLFVEAFSKKAFETPQDISLYTVINARTVTIKRGENRGKTFTYTNIVNGTRNLGQWTGDTPFTQEIDMPKKGRGVVIIFQDAGFGPVRAAKRFASR